MKLLLAEDERELSDALTVILTHSNYLVDAVYTGTDALDYLQVEHYDGVILDVMMPGMDGFEVLKTVRAAGNTVPVLMLTARSDVDDRVTGLDLGADDYLTSRLPRKNCLPESALSQGGLPMLPVRSSHSGTSHWTVLPSS